MLEGERRRFVDLARSLLPSEEAPSTSVISEVLLRIEQELADVGNALRRLDDGTYGTCESCGRPIPDERLGAFPAARYCVEDQRRLELARSTALG